MCLICEIFGIFVICMWKKNISNSWHQSLNIKIIVIYFLTKIGLITPEFLKRYRKHALVVVLILAAIITPPDVASQVIVAIPILILYEIGIKVSQRVIKNQKKNANKSPRV